MGEELSLIAEIGVNHDGDLARAWSLVEAAAAAGFDSVKFQYWRDEEMFAPGIVPSDVPSLGLGELAELRNVARACGLGFIVTADGVLACQDLAGLDLDALKIGSGDIDNPWLLEAAAATGLPLIVSTGMSREHELPRIQASLADVADLVVLHCVSAYPTAVADAGLSRLRTLRDLWKRPVGFSDHTIGVAAAAAAVALGACVVEKHITWDPDAPGPDHAMSLPVDQASAFVDGLRGVHAALSGPVPTDAELKNRERFRKGIYLVRSVQAGEPLSVEDLRPLRPALSGIPALHRDEVSGRAVLKPLAAGTLLSWDDLGEPATEH